MKSELDNLDLDKQWYIKNLVKHFPEVFTLGYDENNEMFSCVNKVTECIFKFHKVYRTQLIIKRAAVNIYDFTTVSSYLKHINVNLVNFIYYNCVMNSQ